MSAVMPPQASASSRWVCFQLAGQLYGIAILQVQEVLSGADIEPVPGAPREVLGVVNLRGSIVTVLELRSCLHLPPLAAPGIIVIVSSGSQIAGLRVDGMADVLNIPQSAIQPPPLRRAGEVANTAAPCIEGLVNRRDEVLTLLDVPKLLSAQPRA